MSDENQRPLEPMAAPHERPRRKWSQRHRTLFKLGVIAALTLLLMVPLALLLPVVGERTWRRDAAVQEMQAGWGTSQTHAKSSSSSATPGSWTRRN